MINSFISGGKSFIGPEIYPIPWNYTNLLQMKARENLFACEEDVSSKLSFLPCWLEGLYSFQSCHAGYRYYHGFNEKGIIES